MTRLPARPRSSVPIESTRQRDPARSHRWHGLRVDVLLLVLLGLCLLVPRLAAPSTVRAADPDPSPDPTAVTMTVEPLLGGTIRANTWVALRVQLQNPGPAIEGELRISNTSRATSIITVPIELPTGARQEHIVHARSGTFGSRLRVDLVANDGTTLLSTRVAVPALDVDTLGVFVVAERPDRLVGDVRAGLATGRGRAVHLAPIGVGDLPDRVEAWAPVDRLIWQDVSPSTLSVDQTRALLDWVALGGELVIVAGSGGLAGVSGFPEELLPYHPERTIEVTTADLAGFLGTLPAGATPLPAITGTPGTGTILAWSGDDVIASRLAVGQGSVALIGIDLGASWLSGSSTATDEWARLVSSQRSTTTGGVIRDQGVLAEALSVLPSVDVPQMDQLFLLFLAYVILLGPVSYLILGRLDRREWAWVTMPILVLAFSVAAFLMGTVLRGSTVVVNQLAIVQGATGTDRGVADVRVGVFSPSRRTFEVTLPDGALIADGQGGDDDGTPLLVTLGGRSRVHGLQVGYGDLRSFEARTSVPAPRLEASLRLTQDRVTGTVRNASAESLEDVTFAYAGGVATLGDLAPGQTAEVDLAGRVGGLRRFDLDQLIPGARTADGTEARTISARRAIVRALAGRWWDDDMGSDPLAGYGPVLLGWRSEPVLEVELGETATTIGETLYVASVPVNATGAVAFTGRAIDQAMVDLHASDGWSDGGSFVLGRGTMIVDYRAPAFEGTLSPTKLLLQFDRSTTAIGAVDGEPLAPLPPAAQPDQVDPVATRIDGVPDGPRDLPRVQLLDRATHAWVELSPMSRGRTWSIAGPERFIDPAGRLQVRFVHRDASTMAEFAMNLRLEGEVR